MPEALHRKLEQIADKKGLSGERRDAFVYGLMRKTGWKPKRERVDKKKKKSEVRIPEETHLSHAMNKTDRLIRLNAKTDELLQFRQPDEESGLAKWSKRAVVGAGLGFGGYYGGRAIADTRVGRYAQGVAGAAGESYKQYGALRSGASAGLGYGRGAAAMKAAGGLWKRLRGLRFQSRATRIIQLNAALDSIIEFKTNPKGQDPENNFRRAAGMGFLIGGPVGMVAGGIAAPKYKQAGVVYKKRDALGHAGIASLGGIAGGAIGAVAGRGRPVATIGGQLAGTALGYGMGMRHTLKKRQMEQKVVGHLV